MQKRVAEESRRRGLLRAVAEERVVGGLGKRACWKSVAEQRVAGERSVARLLLSAGPFAWLAGLVLLFLVLPWVLILVYSWIA